MPAPTPRAGNVVPAAPAPVLFGVRLLPGHQIEMTWTVVAGRGYQVRFKNDLNDPEWMPLDNPIVATGSQLVVTVDMSLSAQSYYRLVLLN